MALTPSLDAARDFFDALDAGIVVLDAELAPLWSNAFYRAHIAGRMEVCEKHCFTGLVPGDARCEDCLPPQVVRTGRTLDTVRSIRDESGVLRSFRVVLTPIEGGTGGVAVFMLPVGAGDHAPGSAWRERFLLSAIRNSNDAVFALDRQHTVRFWNRGAEDLFGWNIESAVGKPVHHLFPGDASEAIEVFTPVDPLLPLANRELEMRSLDRGSIWVEVSRTPLLDGSGNPNGYSFVVRDITERRQALEKMAFTERMTAVGNMAAALAHEIGTPLGVIANNAEYLLLDLDAGDDRREDLEIILQEAERIGGLVRELLEFARPEEPVFDELRLEIVLQRVERLLGHTARKQGSQLTVRLEDGLLPVYGDGKQLEQVVLNLAMNALQALGSGGEVSISLAAGDLPVDTAHAVVRRGVRLSVVDTGPGLGQGDLERIFHPFYTTKPNGTGLGLAVCKRIVEHHRGHLEAERSREGGAAFHVWLPALEPEESR